MDAREDITQLSSGIDLVELGRRWPQIPAVQGCTGRQLLVGRSTITQNVLAL